MECAPFVIDFVGRLIAYRLINRITKTFCGEYSKIIPRLFLAKLSSIKSIILNYRKRNILAISIICSPSYFKFKVSIEELTAITGEDVADFIDTRLRELLIPLRANGPDMCVFDATENR